MAQSDTEKGGRIPSNPQQNINEINEHNANIRNQSTPSAKDSKSDPKTHHKVSIRENTTFSWENVGTWDSDIATDKKKSLKNLKKIESYVLDHFFGDWYWNTGIMIGTCFFSWLVARVGLGFFSLLVVLLATNSVYRIEFRRFNRDIRDNMTRIKASNRLEEELESMEWLNSFLDKFWVIYMPALSEQVLFIANDIMKDQAPGMGIEKISLDEFTLGSKAPRVNSIKSYTKKGKDHIEMDWAFSFAPNDTDDMTKNEIKKKINPKVALGVTIGKAFISKSLPILVEDMAFTGRMNIKLKLSENFPHIKMVSVQFLEAPTIDYALKPVGGDTLGLDIMKFIPGLSSFVNTLIHSNLRPMLYAPNSLDIDVEEILAQQSNDSNGCVAVSVRRCMKLKTGANTKENSINPYVELKVSSNGDVQEKTKVKKLINDPIFMETKYILVNNLDGVFLTFNVFNFIEDQADDKLIGSVEVPMVDLLQKEVQTSVVKNIVESGKIVGKIEFDLRYFPCLKPLELDDGSKEENTDSEVGIMKINLHAAENLELSESVIGLLNPYAEIFVDDKLAKACRRLRKTNEPNWNQSFESLITQQSETKVLVLVKDSANENIVAKLDANLQDLIFETSRGQQWIKCPPVKKGGVSPRLKITAHWKALGITDDKVVDTNFNASIGGLRLHIRGATDLKNLEAVGEVDPYVKIMVNGKLRAKTSTIGETCNPVYDTVYFFPIDNEHQHILLSIMDAEPDEKDRSLGSCAVHVNDFIKKNDKGYLLGYDGSNEIIEQPVLYNGENKGYLSYSVSFVPNIPIFTQNQLKNKKAYQKHLEEMKAKEEAKKQHEIKLITEHPDEYEWAELGDEDMPPPPRVEMPLEDIIKYRAGTIQATILQGRLEKPDLFVHTLFDELATPSGVTPKNESRNLTVPSSAECFVRDLPNSKMVFRVSKKFEVQNEDDVRTERIFDTIEILKKSYKKPIDLRIDEKNHIRVQLDFIPTAVKLHPLDTILDVGHMKMEILRGENLPAIDLNGKSDPMAVVKLDGVEIFKTDKKRKTLDPQWNETTEFPMLSRSRQVLLVQVYDWDLTHDPELLGTANIDFSTMEPHDSTQFVADLNTQGKIHLRCTFKPEYIRPKVGAGGGLPIDFSDIAGAPLKLAGGAAGVAGNVVGGGIGFAGDGLSKGGSFLKGFGKLKRKKNNNADTSTATDSGSVATPSKTSMQDDDNLSASTSVANSPSKNGSRSQYTNDLQSLRSGQTAQTGQTGNGSGQDPGKQLAPGENPDLVEDDEEDKGPAKVPEAGIGALPNIHAESLPPPQKPTFGHPPKNGHMRTTSDVSSHMGADSSFASSINGANAIAGRLSIMSASGYSSKNLEIKVSLKTSNHDKTLYKTRSAKEKLGQYKWNESCPFQSVPSGQLVLLLRENHTFSSDVVVDTLTMDLSDYLDKHEDITLNGSSGSVLVNLRYVST